MILLIGLLLLSSCVNDLKQIKALSEKGSGVEVARGVKTYYYGPNGNVKGILSAPVLYRYLSDTPYMLMDSGLRVNFYNDSLQLQTVLTAKKGRYFEKTNDIVVQDSVVVVTVDGNKLLTDELHWDPRKQVFYTHKPARLLTETRDVVGKDGLTAPGDLSTYTFFNPSGEMEMDSTFMSGGTPDSTRAVDSGRSTPPIPDTARHRQQPVLLPSRSSGPPRRTPSRTRPDTP